MNQGDQTTTLTTIRRFLVGIFLVGLVGTGGELLLIEHTDGFWQWVPLLLIILALVVLCWAALKPGPVVLRVFQGSLLLLVLSGFAGCLLHYLGNVEFELEMYPSRNGFELFRESIAGATPALAPGTMMMLGLVGWVYIYRHPRLGRTRRKWTSEDKGGTG
ncbi:MAG: hypothetical protein V3R94_06375 [Acidobacteriota bacterium]